jgi:hypothetical protein
VTYIREERGWSEKAKAEGRLLDPGRLLPVLPSSVANRRLGAGDGDGLLGTGNGHGHAGGNGHGGHEH